MHLFLSWEIDLASQLKIAAVENDSGKMRKYNQDIARVQDLLQKWVSAIGGDVVVCLGTHGELSVPADKLEEVERIHGECKTAVDAPFYMGVGVELFQAEQALSVSKLRGSSITLWSPDVQKELKDYQEKLNKPDTLQSVLTKADETSMSSPALQPSTRGGGMQGPTRPASPAKPKPEASEHSQGEAIREYYDGDMPPAPEQTHAEADLEEQLHGFAQESQRKDDAYNEQLGARKSHIEELKQQIVQVLQRVKKQAQVFEAIKEQSPQTYKVMMDMVSAVITMAKEITGGEEPVQKSEEDLAKALPKAKKPKVDPVATASSIEDLPPGRPVTMKTTGLSPMQKINFHRAIETIHYDPYRDVREQTKPAIYDYSHLLPLQSRADGYRLFVTSNPMVEGSHSLSATLFDNKENFDIGRIGATTYYRPDLKQPALSIGIADVEAKHRGKGLGQAAYTALMAHAKHTLNIHKIVGGKHSTMAHQVHQKLAQKYGMNYHAEPNPEGDVNPGPFDERYKSYKYTIKAEESFEENFLKTSELDPLLKVESISDITPGIPFNPNKSKDKRMGLFASKINTLMPMGSTGVKYYDYSHLLDPDKHSDYKLIVSHGNYRIGVLKATIHHLHPTDASKHFMGQVSASLPGGQLKIGLAELDPQIRGKGIGQAAYIALMAHAKNVLGATHVKGAEHSSMASKLHQKLAERFGMNYEARPNIDKKGSLFTYGQEQWEQHPPGPFDDKYRSYKYTLKSEKIELNPELPPEDGKVLSKETEDEVGDFDPAEVKMGILVEMEHTDDKNEALKIALDHLRENPQYYSKLKEAGLADELEKEATPESQPKAHHHLMLPPGTQIDHSAQGGRRENSGHVKVTTTNGDKWREVWAGQVRDQEGNPISSLRQGSGK